MSTETERSNRRELYLIQGGIVWVILLYTIVIFWAMFTERPSSRQALACKQTCNGRVLSFAQDHNGSPVCVCK